MANICKGDVAYYWPYIVDFSLGNKWLSFGYKSTSKRIQIYSVEIEKVEIEEKLSELSDERVIHDRGTDHGNEK